jgi:hypothetical protein
MKFLITILLATFFSSSTLAEDYCFKKYGAEENRDGLTFQTSISQSNLVKELLFTSKNSHLSVLVFEKSVTENEIAKMFELMLASKYESSELSQINPTRLNQKFNFAKKLVFPKNQRKGRHESHLLFSKDDCHIILKQEKWNNPINEVALRELVDSAMIF